MKVPVLRKFRQTLRAERISANTRGALRSMLPTRVVDVANFGFIGFLSLYFFRPLSEPDFYWHIMVGEDIIKHGDYGAKTLQTWGSFDPSWMTTQSLSEILMYLIWSEFGKAGIALMRLSLWLYVIYWFLNTFRFNWENSKKPVIIGKWLVFSTGLLIGFGFIQERPAAISIFLTTLVFQDLVKLLVNEKKTFKKRTFLIFCIWPLFHPGWILPYSLAILIIFWKAVEKGISKIHLSYLELSFLLIPFIPLLVPADSKYYESLLTISERGRRWISEWQPVWKLPLTSVVLWLVILYLIVTLILVWQKSAFQFDDYVLTLIVIAILTFATIFAIRNAIYLVVFLAALLGQSGRVNNRTENTLATQANHPSIPKAIVVLSVIPLLFVFFTLLNCAKLSFEAGLENRKSDLEIVLSEIQMDIEKPVKIINSPNYGGNIHYLLRSKGVPLIDGRVDRYSDQLQQNIDEFLNKSTGWRKVYRENLSEGCAALLSKDDEIRSKIASLGFTLKIHRGDFYWYEKAC